MVYILSDGDATLSLTMSTAAAAKSIADGFTGRNVLVHIPDGRKFSGNFVCVDSDVNVILANTDELRSTPDGATSSRHVGMVMVPGEYIVKIEVKQEPAPSHAAFTSRGSSAYPDDEAMYT